MMRVSTSRIVPYDCSKYTPQKNEDFRFFLRTHIKITDYTLRRNIWADPSYHYFDITAGPGKGEYGPGSPVIFCEEIKSINRQYQATFIEYDEKKCQELRLNLTPYADNRGHLTIHCGDHHSVLGEYIRTKHAKDYGLLFDDPTGQIPSFDLLAKFAEYYPRIDILIYVAPTNIKRQYQSRLCSNDLRLEDFIKQIPKAYWLIRKPQGRHQWTFLLGTNWDSFPCFKSRGFYHKDSEQGQEIFNRINYTKDELNGTNRTLFD